MKPMCSYPSEIRFRSFFLFLKKQRCLVHNIGIAYDTGISGHFFRIARKHEKTQFVISAIGSALKERYIPNYSDVFCFVG